MADRAGQERVPAQRHPAIKPGEAAKAGLREIAELTAKDAEGVTAVETAQDGGWVVGVEVVEERRVPSSADVLALYEADIDADGSLLSYRRVRRYARGQGGPGAS
jgi:hypothetical protein